MMNDLLRLLRMSEKQFPGVVSAELRFARMRAQKSENQLLYINPRGPGFGKNLLPRWRSGSVVGPYINSPAKAGRATHRSLDRS